MKVSVIIPAYNEEKSISETIDTVKEVMDNNFKDYELIVVDDGSKDNTKEIMMQKKDKAKVVFHEKNMGKARALLTGFKNATGDVLVTIDADLSYPPTAIPTIVEEIAKGNDLVVGSRFRKGFAKGLPIYRNMANIIGAFVLSIIVSKRVTDATSGLRALTKKVMEYDVKAKNLDFEIENTTVTLSKGLKYKEVPINFMERRGVSKLQFFRDIFRFLKIAINAKHRKY